MYMVDKRTQHVGQHSANMLHMLANMLRWFKPALTVAVTFALLVKKLNLIGSVDWPQKILLASK